MLGWTLAFIFLSIVRGSGTVEVGSVKIDMWLSLLVSCVMGPVFGAISSFAQILTEERGYKKISIQGLLLWRTLYVILFLFGIVSISYIVFAQNISFIDFIIEPGSAAIYLYIIVIDSLLFSIRQVSLFLGQGNLWKLFRGKFYMPREEERIFMFLDLKDSTAHAERLGHIQYSLLIQDCFSDLGIVVENEAEIYQYVGDEVILTWKQAAGLRNQNCIKAFYNFKYQLQHRDAYYQEHYNCRPFFKAGVHAGIVTVTEVGKYKKEIAYHGDTINVAARIQGKCNEYGAELLVSQYLLGLIDAEALDHQEIGSVALKGKQEQVSVFSLEET